MRVNKVLALVLGLAAATTVITVTTGCAGARVAGPAGGKPTVVLLSGAFEDGSSWGKVTRQLQADGYPVLVPAVPLRGVATDIAAVAGQVQAVPGPKVLVGHSYGGLLVSGLAGQLPDVTALVYVAAFIPEAGETAGQLNSSFPGSLIGPATTHTVAGPDGPEVLVNPASYREIFNAGADPADAAAEAAAQRPIRAAAFDEKVTAAAPAATPKYAVVATEDKAISPDAERFQAQRAKAVVTEVRAPHAVPAADPDAVTKVIRHASEPRP
ncbi:alpha/beta hydrolase [Pseudonocardia eucalypti]|uniref:Alpha/beta hydrolase n=1 Tax=Pseudonocardia eucalypti TaxID=648755 RepID=A0ABP9QG13_9PSEU|nr:pimeloyl-ACP methyl ester carboxylesterase [Pseudonocardia eucalypti]